MLHLLHHFNNFAPPYGPATIHSTIVGPGVAQDDMRYHQYQYFSFNDTTIIAFVEIPKTELKGTDPREGGGEVILILTLFFFRSTS